MNRRTLLTALAAAPAAAIAALTPPEPLTVINPARTPGIVEIDMYAPAGFMLLVDGRPHKRYRGFQSRTKYSVWLPATVFAASERVELSIDSRGLVTLYGADGYEAYAAPIL